MLVIPVKLTILDSPNVRSVSLYSAACSSSGYTILARTLNQWASYLHKNGYIKEAREVLEYAVSTGTDVSGHLMCGAFLCIQRPVHHPEEAAWKGTRREF